MYNNDFFQCNIYFYALVIYDIELDVEYLKDWKLLMISDVFCTLVLKYAIAF